MSGPTKAQLIARVAELEADVDRLVDMLDPTKTVEDMEMKIHRGEAIATMRIGHGDGHATPGIRLLAAVTPAGTFQPWRISFEVVKPGGRTSHEIRASLEAQLAKLRGPS